MVRTSNKQASPQGPFKDTMRVLSRVRLLGTPWTAAPQAATSMGSSRQEFQSGLPFPPPGGLPDSRTPGLGLT